MAFQERKSGKPATDNVRVVLLDIEGTVCPISFVKNVLYPYALDALQTNLPTLRTKPNFQKHLSSFPPEHVQTDEALLAHVRHLTSTDTKAPYWKSLQGYLWASGYADGSLCCPMFPDVAPAMKRWAGADTQRTDGERAVRIAIFSSGSVAAQKLCFGHAGVEGPRDHGIESEDLNPLISAYFDTTTAGPKMEDGSYIKIYQQLKDAASPADGAADFTDISQVLFLSDNVYEVHAALKAGMQSWIVFRVDNAPVSREDMAGLIHNASFDGVNFG